MSREPVSFSGNDQRRVAGTLAALVVALVVIGLPPPSSAAADRAGERHTGSAGEQAPVTPLVHGKSAFRDAEEPCNVPPPDPDPDPPPDEEEEPTPTPTPTPTPSPTPASSPTSTTNPTPTPSPTPTPTPTPTWGPPPGPRLGSPEIFGYLVNWSLDAQIDYGAITTVAYFGLAAGADGELKRKHANGSTTTEYSRWRSSKVTNAIAQAHANGAKFVLTVERMAWSEGGKAVTRALLGNPEARTRLVADIVKEVGERGVDGVSLDFEPILSDQRENTASFVRELRAGLYAADPASQLTFAATGSQSGLNYSMLADLTASGAMDAVIVMGYPMRAIDAKYAGGLAPMKSATSYDLVQVTKAYLNKVAPDKIVMALPWYGRQWPTVTADVNSPVQLDRSLYDRPRNIGYVGALQLAARYGRQVDPVEQSAWSVFRWRLRPGCPETWKQVYYDDVETLAAKYDWVVLTQRLAGIGIFALGYDGTGGEMWKLLRVKYRGLVDTKPPVGTISVAEDEKLCQAPLLRLALGADDGADGSGAVYVRLSNAPDVGPDGVLTKGRTYPAVGEIQWPMDDASVGGSSAIGNRTVYAQWRDVAGNWSPKKSITFGLDAPAAATVSVASGAAFVSSPTVNVRASQTSGQTISRVLVSNVSTLANGVLAKATDVQLGQTTPFSLIDPATGGMDADGARAVYAQWLDSVGCWSAPVEMPLTLDRVAPTGSLSIADGATVSATGTVRLLAPASDATSGVATLQLSNDKATWQNLTPTADPISWSAGAVPDGTWTIYARWRDRAGNTSSLASTSILLDRNGPNGSIKINSGATATAATVVTVNASATDAVSEVSAVLLSNSSATTSGVLTFNQRFTPGVAVNWSLAGAGAGSTVADGPHAVYAQWQDSLGNWSGVASATIIVDRTSPSVTVPRTGLRQGSLLGLSTVPVNVTWTATDSASGVTNATMESSRDGGAWRSVSSALAQSSASVDIDGSGSWRVRISAVDAAGNVGGPVESASFRASIIEDSSTLVRYAGTWKKASSSSASGGTTRYATARGATAALTFTGRGVAWVAPVGAGLGQAKVIIDGNVVAKIDLKSSAQQRVLVFTRNWVPTRKHTIKIRVLGTDGRPRVELDAFVVLT